MKTLLLYLATLRAGYVYLPLNNAYQQAELSYFIENAQPGVVVCASRHFPWISTLALALSAALTSCCASAGSRSTWARVWRASRASPAT